MSVYIIFLYYFHNFLVFINVEHGSKVLLKFPPCALTLKIKITQHMNINHRQLADMKTPLIPNDPILNKFFNN